jgi:four helix bundle protein
MAGFRDFREIAAWQRSREVRTLAYQLLRRREAANDFKFRDQLRDASRSAPRNIAEGFARYRHKEFAQFVRVAKGSMAEVLDAFIDAVDSGYLPAEDFPRHERACKQALAAINGLIRYLESNPDPPQ